jgi:pimeloyl-ACP methyl ester carboxylesterase
MSAEGVRASADAARDGHDQLLYTRSPAPSPWVREHVVEVDGVELSGLLATPTDGSSPRALVVAVHGAGMHAGYFDCTTEPGLSLLELGSRLGYAVWAPDRPGIGASAHLAPEAIGLFEQARLLHDAIPAVAAAEAGGAGVVLVGHSYGLKVSLATAATRPSGLIGLDGSGTGIRYAFHWGQPPARTGPAASDGGRGPAWGPDDLYPPATFTRGRRPLHTVPPAQAGEGGRWPDDLRQLGPDVDVPLRFTFAEHEAFWPVDQDHFDELRAALPNAPSIGFEVVANAGHNISLGWSARPYHLGLLAFVETCLLARSAARRQDDGLALRVTH